MKNETNYEFTISADQLEKSFTGADAIKNEVITGSVTLTKIDDTTKAAISGVEFKLYRKNTAAAGIDTEIPNSLTDSGNYITDSNGKIMVENLEYGHYYFTEVKAKAGYHEAEAPVELSLIHISRMRKNGRNPRTRQSTGNGGISWPTSWIRTRITVRSA